MTVQATEDEYRRLLYVAMTRAADRLIICGAAGQRRPPEGCWYHLVRGALEPLAVKETAGDQDVLRLRRGIAPGGEQQQFAFALEPAITVPAWLDESMPAEAAPILLRPSGSGSVPMHRSRAAADTHALARGRLVHRLMQALPDVPGDRRDAAARQYLERAAEALTAGERDEMVRQVLAVLGDPRFAPLTATGSRSEVPIVGRIPHRGGGSPTLVSGQLDRLAITDEAVLIADYKTDRPAPPRLADVPESYLAQLALYRAVLAGLYPDRPVRAALVWTEVPDFMEIPGPALDAALARVTAG